MARNEQDREDLFAEATAYVYRGNLLWPSRQQTVFVGQRADGRFSLYFGADPVYHFSPTGQLRRAFVDGQLYRTQGSTLARLTRQRTESATELLRHDLAPDQLQTFVSRMHDTLAAFAEQLPTAAVPLQQSTEPPADFLRRVGGLCERALHHSQSLAPRLRGKR